MNQMTLSTPIQFPEEYREVVNLAIQRIYSSLKWTLEQQFGFYDMPHIINPFEMMLSDPLSVIARAATGELQHSDEIDGELVECIQTVMELLFSNPLLSSYHIPDEFWTTPLGEMITRAQLWLRSDELITIVECARRFDITQQAVSQAIDAGRLHGYHDPDAKQRQGSRKVSASECAALWSKS